MYNPDRGTFLKYPGTQRFIHGGLESSHRRLGATAAGLQVLPLWPLIPILVTVRAPDTTAGGRDCVKSLRLCLHGTCPRHPRLPQRPPAGPPRPHRTPKFETRNPKSDTLNLNTTASRLYAPGRGARLKHAAIKRDTTGGRGRAGGRTQLLYTTLKVITIDFARCSLALAFGRRCRGGGSGAEGGRGAVEGAAPFYNRFIIVL